MPAGGVTVFAVTPLQWLFSCGYPGAGGCAHARRSSRAAFQGRNRAGARSECDPGRVGEAEAGVAGRAFGEHGGEDAGPLVEVVVDFGRGLALVGAQDPAYVLVRLPL